MDFQTLIRTRYSVRAYRPDPVEDAKLAAILEAARLAPTAAKAAAPVRLTRLPRAADDRHSAIGLGVSERHRLMARSGRWKCDDCPPLREGLFRSLRGELRRFLDENTVPHIVPAGQPLFIQGAPALAMHCVCDGLVKVHKLSVRGEEQIIRVLGAGEVVGYRAVLAGETFGATAQALVETKVCTIPAEVLISLVRRSPDFAVDLLVKLAQELRISEDELISLWHKTVRQRLATVLLVLTQKGRPAPADRDAPTVSMSRRDLARLIATTPESVSRSLRRLVLEGAIQCDRYTIRLVSLPALRRAARHAEPPGLDQDQVAD